jgi:twinkle protein
MVNNQNTLLKACSDQCYRYFSNENVKKSVNSSRHHDSQLLENSTFNSSANSHPNNTYVSSHYRISNNEIMNYLKRKELVYRENNHNQTLVIKECPFCHPTKNKPDNQYKLFIFTNTGAHFCHRCQAHGSWFDFKVKLGDIITPNKLNHSDNMNNQPVANTKNNAQNQLTPKPTSSPNISQVHLASFAGNLKDFPDIHSWLLKNRGLKDSVLELYKVGAGKFKFANEAGSYEDQNCVTFPWARLSTSDNKCTKNSAQSPQSPQVIYDRIKLRSMKEKSNQRLFPTGGPWGLFGLHTIPDTADSIVLTEGEFDAMSVYQCTGLPTLSLPNGAASLPVDLLPYLERFKQIYLWLDDDLAGQQGAEKFAKKLGVGRCFIVKTRNNNINGPKDANDAMLAGLNLLELLESASPLPHERITNFQSIRSEVYREFSDPTARRGIQSTSLPSLNKILKGHRKGELSVITGATGVGKSTILSQISLDYCASGVSTLWGSFEIKNSRLARTMLSQFSGVDFSVGESINRFDYWADKFENLPMYFMRFFGSSNVDQVLDAMDYAVYVHDVEHIILDNLQFMLAGQYSANNSNKFDLQDKAIDAFRAFATNKNVHITLVIHPRKEAENVALGVSSVFGSAKATQEADNVIIIQAPSPNNQLNSHQQSNELSGNVRYNPGNNAYNHMNEYRRLEIKKNRFDGELGRIPFIYDKNTCRIIEVDANQSAQDRRAKQLELEERAKENESFSDAAGSAFSMQIAQQPHDKTKKRKVKLNKTQTNQVNSSAAPPSHSPPAPPQINIEIVES